jgi:hypothetical protein
MLQSLDHNVNGTNVTKCVVSNIQGFQSGTRLYDLCDAVGALVTQPAALEVEIPEMIAPIPKMQE